MAMVSHLHHFFNADTCQSYIHTLRWKDRPLRVAGKIVRKCPLRT
jgi:hypothetical protein